MWPPRQSKLSTRSASQRLSLRWRGPSYGVLLPADVVSDAERDRIVDAAAGCLPWTQTILDSLQDLPDVPPVVVECAQAAVPSDETDRAAADMALFGGDFMTVLNLVLPPDCLPQTGAFQADTPAGRLTASQLMLVGVSPRERRVCSGTSRRPQRGALRAERH